MSGTEIGRPEPGELAPFFAGYVARVPESDVLRVLAAQIEDVRAAARACDAARETFRYAPGKWSVREVFGHVVDAERVFGYRAFCIARGETQPLPGFDENQYVERSGFDAWPLADLVADFVRLRESNQAALGRLDPAAFRNVGTANGGAISVRALAFIMAGHVRHHLSVLALSYGIAPSR
jgi:DinB superfamily